jgi:hypothetical protein
MAEPGSIPQLLRDLDALDPVDQAKVTYGTLQNHPDWPRLSDTQKDTLFQRYQPGGAEHLTGADLPVVRRAHEGQQAPDRSQLSAGGGGGRLGADVAAAAPDVAAWAAKNVVAPAATAAGGRALGTVGGTAIAAPFGAGPLGGVVGGVLGGATGAGLAEYGRQKYEGEEIDPWKIGGAAVTEGVVGPALGLYKTLRHGIPAVVARTPGKVKAAKEAAETAGEAVERRAAGEVRPAVTAAVPRQGNVPKLFADFEEALATNPPPIPAAQLEQGLAQTATKYAPISPVADIEKVNAAAQRLKNVLVPTTEAGAPSPVASKIAIDDMYKQLKELRAVARRMPAGSAERSQVEHLRGLINKDLDAYAALPGAHPAAGLLREANQAARSERAVERVHELADEVLYTRDMPYGPKQAAALAKKLRTDKQLKGLLNDPAELDALVDAATTIGGRAAEDIAKIRASIPEALPLPAGGAGISVVGAADILRRITWEMIKEGRKIATTPRAQLVASALLHTARGGLQEARERELAQVRRPSVESLPGP